MKQYLVSIDDIDGNIIDGMIKADREMAFGCWHGTEAEFYTVESVATPRILTINQAGCLRDLLNGVERGLKLRYYPMGTEDADHPMVQVLRAFTYAEGALYPHDADIRDAHVWTSGFMEHWFPVEQLLKALDNMQGTHGLDQPMAVIDNDKEN